MFPLNGDESEILGGEVFIEALTISNGIYFYNI